MYRRFSPIAVPDFDPRRVRAMAKSFGRRGMAGAAGPGAVATWRGCVAASRMAGRLRIYRERIASKGLSETVNPEHAIGVEMRDARRILMGRGSLFPCKDPIRIAVAHSGCLILFRPRV